MKIDRKQKIKQFKSLLEQRNFELAVEVWLEFLKKRPKSPLNQKFKRFCRSYAKNIGYVLYDFSNKFRLKKIKPLLDFDLDLVIYYVSKASAIVKKDKFLGFVNNLYQKGYRSEKLIGLLVYIKCKELNFAEGLEILDKELGAKQKKIIDLQNILPSCQTLVKKLHAREAAELLEKYLDYQQENVGEKIIFKYLIKSFNSRSNLELTEEFLTDLERLFELDIDCFKRLTLRYATNAFQNNTVQLLETVEKVKIDLQTRKNLEDCRLQEAIQELQVFTQDFQSYFQDIPKPSYKKMEDLKVALCISGQMRDYEQAFESWDKHILKPLQPDVFIHTWNDVGFRVPSIHHADRVISGKFLAIYKQILLNNYSNSFKDSYLSFEEDYPSFKELLDSKNQYCNFQQLSQFYQTKNIVIDDAEDNYFQSMDNQMKMMYKISACHDLQDKVDRQYDLVIRIRPDLDIRKFSPDWSDIYQKCYEQNAVFLDTIKGIKGNFQLVAGDVFAVGTVKSIGWYSSLNTIISFYLKDNFLNIYEYSAHETLLWHLWYGGLKIYSLNMGSEYLSPTFSTKEIYNALSQDIDLTTAKDCEREMLRALEEDLQASTK
jgi:hypothetical protein